MMDITSETRKQVWDLDQPANWKHTDLVTGGSTTELDWDFLHNKANEITEWDNQTNQVVPGLWSLASPISPRRSPPGGG